MSDFVKYVEDAITDINFEGMYKKINDEMEYVPEKLIYALQMTLYFLEMKERLIPPIAGMFSHYLGVLRGFDEHQKSMNKEELLYIIYKMQEQVTKANSPRGIDQSRGLYL